MNSPIRVKSEVGTLRRVLLHRPGQELENLMPQYLSRQLFEDIPYLVHAREEHDQFAQTLRESGVEVVYLLDLVAQAVAEPGVRERFVSDFMAEIGLSVRTIESHRARLMQAAGLRNAAELVAAFAAEASGPEPRK